MSLKEKAKSLKAQLPILYLALGHPKTPWYAKAVGIITIGYALSPIDLIPDFIPVLGYLDDIILLPLLIRLMIKCIPCEVMESCKVQAEGMWQNGKPKKWYYAVPILFIWLILIVVIIKNIFR